MRRPWFAPACALALAAVSCGDPVAPDRLTGSWEYNAPHLENLLVDCSLTGLVLELKQTGGTFTGKSSTHGRFECVNATQTFEVAIPTLLDATITGNYVSFSMPTDAPTHWLNSGVLSGSTIAGTTLLPYPVDEAAPALSGKFTMVKRP